MRKIKLIKKMIIGLIIFYLITVLIVGRFLAYNDVKKRDSPNESLLSGLTYKNIEFKGENDIILRGWFVRSSNTVDNRTVFLLHGWLSSRNKLIDRIKLFCENGYNVFIYDQRSHGNSDNALVTYGEGEGNDLISAVNFSKTIPEINQNKLVAAGYSLGTGSTIYACFLSKEPLFKAIVLEGAFETSYDVGFKALENRFGYFFSKYVGANVFKQGVAIWSLGKFKHAQTAQTINKIHNLPIMIVRGEQDELVIKKSSDALINSTNEPKLIWVHSGGHTNASKLFTKDYIEKVIGFLNTNL